MTVKSFCDRHGLNAPAFARMVERLGGQPLHRATVHRWLTGETPPPTADALIAALEQWPEDKLEELCNTK